MRINAQNLLAVNVFTPNLEIQLSQNNMRLELNIIKITLIKKQDKQTWKCSRLASNQLLTLMQKSAVSYLLMENGSLVTDPVKMANLFN